MVNRIISANANTSGSISSGSSSINGNYSTSSSSMKEELTPERKLFYLVKSITKYQASNNYQKLCEICQSMYAESKNEKFSPYMKKAYEKQSTRLLHDLAKKQNYPNAQYLMGLIYQEKKDYKKAAKYFELSFKNKHPMGTYQLAQCYELGHGKFKNLQKAKELYHKSATVGYCRLSMIHLGTSFLNGTLGKKDISQAVYWLKKSVASQNENNDKDLFAKGYYELYKIYASKDNQNYYDIDEALKYLKASAENGSEEALMEICRLEKNNPKKLLYWIKKGAEMNYLDAQIKLATWYLCDNSDVVSQDKALGFYWLKRAALPKNLVTDAEKRNQGCIQYILGTYYETGIEDVQLPDENEALYWFVIAARIGITEAIEKIKEKQVEYNCEEASMSDFMDQVIDKGLYGKPSESSLECQQIINDLPNHSRFSIQI